MKQLIFSVFTALFLASCSTPIYVQVYKISPDLDIEQMNDALVYENEDCKILYDFWGYGGNAGFVFYNKTNENIYLNKEECFFIHNGFAFNYYQNRVLTQSSNSSSTSSFSATNMYNSTAFAAGSLSASAAVSGINFLGYKQTNSLAAGIAAGLAATAGVAGTNTKKISTSSGYSVAYHEERIVCIPPTSAKKIEGYKVAESLYRDCNLLKYPVKKQIRSTDFLKSESPIVFSNIIAYSVGKSENWMRLENEFYIKAITNYPEETIKRSQFEKFCGEIDKFVKIDYFVNASPDKFYIEYSKNNNSKFKH
jgi:hypothetical protein